jgi:predicted metal-dependent hydrolase
MEVKVDGNTIKYEVQYNAKRKKLAIEMGPTGLLTVKAPKNTEQKIIENIIRQNTDWIDSKKREMEQRRSSLKLTEELGKSRYLYLGKAYSAEELLDGAELNEEELKVQLKKFYNSSAKKVINERVKHYQSELKLKPKSVDIMESRTKWGTCSSEKALTFNYRLVMAPIKAIDYVVVHELCHLDHMNHDRSFWRKVGGIMPDYKEQQEFLARYGRFMEL